MSRRYGQAFRLAPDGFEGDTNRSWAQVLRTGRWWDERYGWFEVTREMLQSMAANHGLAGIVSADYDHGIAYADGTGNAIAAGDIIELQVRAGDGVDESGAPQYELWARVEWTDRAAGAIRQREYKYTSAWFSSNFTTNQGEEIGPTLLGFAITNRPVIDSMAPLALRERGAALALSATFMAFAERVDRDDEPEDEAMAGEAGEQGRLAFLLGRLGLRPGATETDAAAKVDELQGEVRTLSAEKTTLAAERDQEKQGREAAEKLLGDIRTVFGFGEKDDVLERCRTLSKQVAEAQLGERKLAAKAVIEKALREHRITPAETGYFTSAIEREIAAEGAPEKVEETATAKLLAARTPDPRAKGTAHGATDAGGGDGEDEVEQLAQKHMSEDADLLELAKTNRPRALLLADERAMQDMAEKARAAASAAG